VQAARAMSPVMVTFVVTMAMWMASVIAIVIFASEFGWLGGLDEASDRFNPTFARRLNHVSAATDHVNGAPTSRRSAIEHARPLTRPAPASGQRLSG
jgi:hypothetical protein